MSKRSPSAERLYRARRAAAKELRLPVEDWRVKRYAVLMCAHNGVQARLASGADINVDNLLKLDAAMHEIRASMPQEPLKVNVKLVEGPIEHCPACGWHRGQPTPEAPRTSPPVDAKPSSSPSAVVRPEPLAPAPTPNVIQLKPPRSVHDGAPLKSA